MAMEVAHNLSYWLFKNLINSIIFQYATIIEKILMLKTLEKKRISVYFTKIKSVHILFDKLIITYYILTSRSGFFETESLF